MHNTYFMSQKDKSKESHNINDVIYIEFALGDCLLAP